jgi:eukaryotic-like serine/threonine-protein kinase
VAIRLEPGTRVTRNVELLRPLGEGGMGRVWLARHLTLGTELAVKFILPEHSSREKSLQRFAREASLAAKIESPHVVEIFDYGAMDDGTPYIVMELLRGETLGEALERRKRLPPPEVGLLISQVAEALGAAHGIGVVHRDIKPANLFLVRGTAELFVKVLDFGIAKQTSAVGAEALTETGGVLGTPYYMSPELLLSPKDVDHRADLWALAVVAYHALTGELPFKGETMAAIAMMIRDGALTPASALVSRLPPEIDMWFKIALCRDIELRFAAAEPLSRAFRRALAGQSLASHEAAQLERAEATTRRELASADEPRCAAAGHDAGASLARSTASGPARADTEPSAPPVPSTTLPTTPAATGDTLRSPTPTPEPDADRADTERSGASDAAVAASGKTFAGTSAGAPAPHAARQRALGLLGAALLVALGLGWALHGLSAGPTPAATSTSAEHAAPDLGPASSGTDAGGLERASGGQSADTASGATASGASPPPTSGPARSAPPAVSAATHATASPSRSGASQATPSASAPSPEHCKEVFVVDEHGDLKPKLECLQAPKR